MVLTESSVKVYFTKDYAMFRMINGNRELDQRKISKIMKDIDEGVDVLAYCPVLVKQKGELFEIVDGQHRFWVARKLKREVYFIISRKDIDLRSISKINVNQSKWKPIDFINSYIQQGYKDYEVLRDFKEKYDIPLTTAKVVLANGYDVFDSGGSADDLESGLFKVKNLEDAESIIESAMLFIESPYWKSRSFVVACAHLIKKGKLPLEEINKRYSENKNLLMRQSTYKDYISNLQIIYNKGQKEHVQII